MTRAVIFDLGRVLIDFDFKIAGARLLKRCPVNMPKLLSLLTQHDLANQFDRGMIDEKEFFETICVKTGLPISMEEFIGFWNEIFTEKDEMVKLAHMLKGKHKVGILSNTNPWHVEHFRKKHSWVFGFDAFIASCDVKMMKPEPAIYSTALKQLGVKPEEAFYTDDIEENIDAAKALGMDAVLFKGYEGFVKEVRKRGLLD